MSKIEFSNGALYEIMEGASIISITIVSGYDLTEVKDVLMNSDNLSTVHFIDNDNVTGIYTNMALLDGQIIINNDDSITFGLRQKSELELRIEALEALNNELTASQDLQDEAIVELASIIGGE